MSSEEKSFSTYNFIAKVLNKSKWKKSVFTNTKTKTIYLPFFDVLLQKETKNQEERRHGTWENGHQHRKKVKTNRRMPSVHQVFDG
jgi:hypothetical protein